MFYCIKKMLLMSILVLICFPRHIILYKYDWVSILNQWIVNNANVHQVTIFVNSSNTGYLQKYNSVFKNIYSIIPSISIDIASSINETITSPIFNNPRDISLYLILHSDFGSDISELQYIIDYLVQLSPKSTRPHCLIIYCTNKQNSDDDYKQILVYAWMKKFLDFSILEIHQNKSLRPLLHFYNPFYDQHKRKYLNSQIAIFPEKLHNAN